MNRKNSRSKKLVWPSLIGAVAIVAAVPLVASPSRQDQYSAEESVQKLKAIGKALQLYRADYEPRPVKERKSPSDAGLPPDIFVLATPGHAWTLAEGMKAFKISHPRLDSRKVISDFVHIYPPQGLEIDAMGPFADYDQWLQQRGENLPILKDSNFGMSKEFESIRPLKKAIVLRLDGTVDIVEFGPGKNDIFRK